MFENIDLVGAVVLLLFISPLFIIVLSGPIEDWLSARKKAAAESAGAPVAPPAGHPAAA